MKKYIKKFGGNYGMKKRFSIYHFLIALMVFSLVLPGFAGAEKKGGNDVQKGSLTIHKFEQEPEQVGTGEEGTGSAGQNAPGEALPGVEFTLIQTHKYNPDTDEWTTFNGTSFKRTTDTNGKIFIDNIDLGRYKIKETDGPDHVVLNDEEYFVDIPMTSKDGETVNYNVHIYPKNETIRGEVVLTKTDGDSNKALKGVTFSLFKEGNDEAIKTGLKTGADGKITVDGLGVGNYYFQETATLDGYLLNEKKVTFTVKKQSESVTVSLENYKEPGVEKEVDENAVNRGEIVTYTITVDLPGDIKSYESFVITDVLHPNLEFISQSGATGFTFNQEGQTLKWTADPQQLSPGTIDITFKAKVSENADANIGIDNVATIDYDNSYETGSKTTPPVIVTPTAGKVKIIKQDGDDETRLPGAEFELRGNGKVYPGSTNSNGTLVFEEVDYGTYELVETKAPEGYNKLTKPREVVVNKDNHSQTIIVDNYKSGWDLPKTGGMGTVLFTFIGLTLMGASLFLYIRRRRGEVA